ncbi:hypothetical protein KEM54_005822 [Ascosphaera aggregata]|nr:hypothetical protein KEM54_005822 [Ascosphaera aggregata]
MAVSSLVLRAASAATNTASATASTTGPGSSGGDGRPPIFRAVGIILAISSGLLIGVSYVLKKVGLLRANVKYNEEAGEGYGYLKNAYWWIGMMLMILGELCNFVAYAFVDAILVTPMGALSVVVTTILSAIILKERLSFVGKVGCFNCIIGSVIIALNAPTQSSVSNIDDMQHYVIAPGFLSYAGVVVVGCAFIALWAGPRYGKRSMFVYISICSWVGGLSVVATQGLGAAIVAQIQGHEQFRHWFLYILLVFVVITLLTEIVYLNKALNIYNAALVTPTYYVYFTSATIVTSAILFRGFEGSALSITTIVMGFMQICSGVVLLQLSKSAKDVPDIAVFKGDLDQLRQVAEQEELESEPKADAVRGAAAIIRRISTVRRQAESKQAKEIQRQRWLESTQTPVEREFYEWDGLHRRKTVSGLCRHQSVYQVSRSNSAQHPPSGISKIPERLPEQGRATRNDQESSESAHSESILSDLTRQVSKAIRTGWKPVQSNENDDDPFLTDGEKRDLFPEDTTYGRAGLNSLETAHTEGGHRGHTISSAQSPIPSKQSKNKAVSAGHRSLSRSPQKGRNIECIGHISPLNTQTTIERKAHNPAVDEEARALVQPEHENSHGDRPSFPGYHATGRRTLSRTDSSSSELSNNLRPEDPFDEDRGRLYRDGL